MFQPRTFRFSVWITGSLAFLTVVCGAGGILLLAEQGMDPISLTVAVVALLLAVGTLDAIRTRVTLSGEEIVMVRGFRRRRLFRGHIDAVSWERRSGIALHLDDGMVVDLPDIGDGKARAAVIRAWVERARRTEVMPSPRERREDHAAADAYP